MADILFLSYSSSQRLFGVKDNKYFGSNNYETKKRELNTNNRLNEMRTVMYNDKRKRKAAAF